jgi:hypothetical protein
VILTGGGHQASVPAKPPTVEWMSGLAAIGAMALTVLVGHNDVALGVVVVHVIARNCVGWMQTAGT